MTAYPHLSVSIPQLATPHEVAPLLGMTALGVVRQCRAGKLPGIKVGGRWLVHVRKLSEQLEGTNSRDPEGPHRQQA
jgi:hypothetical protein